MDQIYIGKQSTYVNTLRRISNYTSYVRRIIRYLKNKCTVCNSQSSFWCEVVFLKMPSHVRKRNERNDVRNTLKFETMF